MYNNYHTNKVFLIWFDLICISILSSIYFSFYLVQFVLSSLSSPACLVQSTLSSLSFLVYLVKSVFSILSCPVFPVQSVLSSLFSPACLVKVCLVQLCLAYLVCPALFILSLMRWCVGCLSCLVQSVLDSSNPFLNRCSILSYSVCPCLVQHDLHLPIHPLLVKPVLDSYTHAWLVHPSLPRTACLYLVLVVPVCPTFPYLVRPAHT